MRDHHEASAEGFDAGDSATVFTHEVVDFQAMVARLSIEHPDVAVSRLQMMVILENDALTGGIPIAVPAVVYAGVAELIAQDALDRIEE